MVSKSEDKTTKKSTKSTAKKETVKKTTKPAAKSAAKVSKAKTAKKETKVVEIVKNPLEDKGMDKVVNEILEYNDKYVAKAHKKDAVVVRGDKAESKNAKQAEVKDNFLKSFTQKFGERKHEAVTSSETCTTCKFASFKAWGRAYKNMFNFKGRTSLYEFWSFNLINYIFAFLLGTVIVSTLMATYPIAYGIVFGIFWVVQFIVNLSVSVRRIHDTGRKAWRGFYMNFLVTLAVLLFAIITPSVLYSDELSGSFLPADANISSVSLLCWGALIVVSAIAYTYYAIKLWVTILFGMQDINENDFGVSAYTDMKYRNKALCFACWYFMAIILVICLKLALVLVSLYAFHP